MVRKCLKCGTVNDNATGSPTEACPNCSVIYAKAEAAAVAGKAPPQRPLPTAKPAPRELRLPLWPTVACVTCLIVGFFVGREQMRYQVASAMTGALAHAFDDLGNGDSGGRCRVDGSKAFRSLLGLGSRRACDSADVQSR